MNIFIDEYSENEMWDEYLAESFSVESTIPEVLEEPAFPLLKKNPKQFSGATIESCPDRKACTIVVVGKNYIILQEDTATLVNPEDLKYTKTEGVICINSEDTVCINPDVQRYAYTRNKAGKLHKAVWDKEKGCYTVTTITDSEFTGVCVYEDRHEFSDINF